MDTVYAVLVTMLFITTDDQGNRLIEHENDLYRMPNFEQCLRGQRTIRRGFSNNEMYSDMLEKGMINVRCVTISDE